MRLVIVPAALAELQDAAAFYTAQVNVDLARAFVHEFERSAAGNGIWLCRKFPAA